MRTLRRVSGITLALTLLVSSTVRAQEVSEEFNRFATQFVAALRSSDFRKTSTPSEVLKVINAKFRFGYPCLGSEASKDLPCVQNRKDSEFKHLTLQIRASGNEFRRGRPAEITLSPFTFPSGEWTQEILQRELGPPSGVTSDGGPGWAIAGGVLLLRQSLILGTAVVEFLWNPKDDLLNELESTTSSRMPIIDDVEKSIGLLRCTTVSRADVSGALSFENPYGFVLYGFRNAWRCTWPDGLNRLLVLGPSEGDSSKRAAALSISVPLRKDGDNVFDGARRVLQQLQLGSLSSTFETPDSRSILKKSGLLRVGNLVLTYDAPEPDLTGSRWERLILWRRNQVDDWLDRQPLAAEDVDAIVGVVGIRRGVRNKISLVDDFFVETTREGQIHIGRSALRQMTSGKSEPVARAIIAFIAGHEAAHSLQLSNASNEPLSGELRRVLECQADVLGTIAADEIMAIFGGGRSAVDGPGALADLRFLTALANLEPDREHPPLAARATAVTFGHSEFIVQRVSDRITEAVLSRRFATAADQKDDSEWSLQVCKRILNYRADLLNDVSIQLTKESKDANTFSGELVYQNRGTIPLLIDAHVRLMGRRTPIGLQTTEPEDKAVDGLHVSFPLRPGETHNVTFQLGRLQLGLEDDELTRLVFSSIGDGNLISVEPLPGVAVASAPDGPRASAAAAPTSRVCSETAQLQALSPEQMKVADFLFATATYASEQFRSLKAGTAVDVSGGAATAHRSSMPAPGSQSTSIFESVSDGASVHVVFYSGETVQAGDAEFDRLSQILRALCQSEIIERAFDGASTGLSGRSVEIPAFSQLSSVTLSEIQFHNTGRTDVALTLHALTSH